MSLVTPTDAKAPVLPIQFVSIEIMPIVGGQYSVAMQATLLDEAELQFIGQELAHERVDTIEAALAIIRDNVAALVPL